MNVDFGYKHLTGLAWLLTLITILLITVLIIRKRGNFGETYDKAVIRYTCYFMWFAEVIKTIRMINHADFGPIGHYPIWMAPLHICSMGLYAYLIIGSKRKSRLTEFITPFGYAVMLLVTSIILTIPASSGILGPVENWSFCFDNILPYQSWLYHGCLVFIPLYMAISGFYRPKWSDIYKSFAVLMAVAAFAQAMNFIFDGSGADFMTLRYGNGNPFAFLLADTPILYYITLTAISLAGISLIIASTIGIRVLAEKIQQRKSTEEI